VNQDPALFSLPAPRHPHPDGGWLPQWLNEELAKQHPPTSRPAATWTRCGKCHAIILTGLDDPCLGHPAAVDPTPLNPYTELACAILRIPTYRLHHQGTTARIAARTRWDQPAGAPGTAPVVPAHRCGRRFPGFTIPPETERQEHAAPPF
jgi:hypothetical protein